MPVPYECKTYEIKKTIDNIQAIPVVIGSFKSAVTKISHTIDTKFAWQRSYFDEFIKMKKMYKNIVCYIKHNVDNWENDEFNKE